MEKIDINLNVTMFRCPCHILSLDIVDVTGVHVVDVGGELVKHRLDKSGAQIASKNALAEIKEERDEEANNDIFE